MNAVDIRYGQLRGSSNDDALATFVTAQNINLYKTRLATEVRPDQRKRLLELLVNELAKLPEPVRRVELMKSDLSSMT